MGYHTLLCATTAHYIYITIQESFRQLLNSNMRHAAVSWLLAAIRRGAGPLHNASYITHFKGLPTAIIIVKIGWHQGLLTQLAGIIKTAVPFEFSAVSHLSRTHKANNTTRFDIYSLFIQKAHYFLVFFFSSIYYIDYNFKWILILISSLLKNVPRY